MVKKVHLHQILEATNSNELFKNYFEAGSEGLLPNQNVCKEVFYAMDNAGLIDCFGVFNSTTLVGFIISSTTVMPHYSLLGTTVISIYIEKEFRRFGTAKELIKCIEAEAIKRRSSAVIVSTPASSKFGAFTAKLGYKKVNEIYGKAL